MSYSNSFTFFGFAFLFLASWLLSLSVLHKKKIFFFLLLLHSTSYPSFYSFITWTLVPTLTERHNNGKTSFCNKTLNTLVQFKHTHTLSPKYCSINAVGGGVYITELSLFPHKHLFEHVNILQSILWQSREWFFSEAFLQNSCVGLGYESTWQGWDRARPLNAHTHTDTHAHRLPPSSSLLLIHTACRNR